MECWYNKDGNVKINICGYWKDKTRVVVSQNCASGVR